MVVGGLPLPPRPAFFFLTRAFIILFRLSGTAAVAPIANQNADWAIYPWEWAAIVMRNKSHGMIRRDVPGSTTLPVVAYLVPDVSHDAKAREGGDQGDEQDHVQYCRVCVVLTHYMLLLHRDALVVARREQHILRVFGFGCAL